MKGSWPFVTIFVFWVVVTERNELLGEKGTLPASITQNLLLIFHGGIFPKINLTCVVHVWVFTYIFIIGCVFFAGVVTHFFLKIHQKLLFEDEGIDSFTGVPQSHGKWSIGKESWNLTCGWINIQNYVPLRHFARWEYHNFWILKMALRHGRHNRGGGLAPLESELFQNLTFLITFEAIFLKIFNFAYLLGKIMT